MKRFCFAMLPALALVLAGCATTGEAGSSEEETAAMEMETAPAEAIYLPPQVPRELNSIAIMSGDLVNDLLVTRHSYARTPTNTFQVTVTMKNVSDDALHVLARTQYFDADRMHQEGPGEWTHVFIPANSIESYQTRSMGTNLEFYHVELMEM